MRWLFRRSSTLSVRNWVQFRYGVSLSFLFALRLKASESSRGKTQTEYSFLNIHCCLKDLVRCACWQKKMLRKKSTTSSAGSNVNYYYSWPVEVGVFFYSTVEAKIFSIVFFVQLPKGSRAARSIQLNSYKSLLFDES